MQRGTQRCFGVQLINYVVCQFSSFLPPKLIRWQAILVHSSRFWANPMTENKWNLHPKLHFIAILDQRFKGHFQQNHKHWHSQVTILEFYSKMKSKSTLLTNWPSHPHSNYVPYRMDKLFLVPKKRSLTTKNSVNIETFAADLISRIDQASAQIIKTMYGKEKSLWVIGIRMYTSSSADFMAMGMQMRKTPNMAMAVLRRQWTGRQ